MVPGPFESRGLMPLQQDPYITESLVPAPEPTVSAGRRRYGKRHCVNRPTSSEPTRHANREKKGNWKC